MSDRDGTILACIALYLVVCIGVGLWAMGRTHSARDFFVGALELKPSQVNAYYGLAEASEALGDMSTALGAMRSFVHLARPDDPFVRRARAALWEWQSLPKQQSAQAPEREE